MASPTTRDFAAVRDFLSGKLQEEDFDFLKRLENEPRMVEAWTKHGHRIRRIAEGQRFIQELLTCRRKAKWFAEASGSLQRSDEHTAKLIAACEELSAHFGSLNPTIIGEANIAVDPNVSEFVEALTWAKAYLSIQGRLANQRIVDALPTSQKNKDPSVAFQVLVCRQTEKLFDQPLYDLVATITEVAYETPEAISPDRVRANYTRDKERQSR